MERGVGSLRAWQRRNTDCAHRLNALMAFRCAGVDDAVADVLTRSLTGFRHPVLMNCSMVSCASWPRIGALHGCNACTFRVASAHVVTQTCGH
jgi:ABC-type microcin C transport system permease subunit YejE